VAEAAVLAALPSAPGQRHGLLFGLVRRLKALPRYSRATADEALPVFERWHALAFRGPMRTKDFAASWDDFRDGWARMRYPDGGATLAGLREWAFQVVPLATPGGSRAEGDLLRLELICEQLHLRHGGGSFPLGERVAAKVLGVSKTSGRRAVQGLLAAGVLRVTAGPVWRSRLATEYLHTGPCMGAVGGQVG
jgi:hypothetical protein